MDAGEVFRRSELRERGWTDAMIRRLLSTPDMTLPNPEYRSGAPMRLYRRARVEIIEERREFTELREAGARRAERSKNVAVRRASDLVAKARAYEPALPTTLDYEELRKRAIRSYNTQSMDRADRATLDSDAAFLARMSWNHFRHHMTDWDATWEGFSGRPGVREAYIAAAESLASHVCERFPVFRDAARAWLDRKQKAAASFEKPAHHAGVHTTRNA